MFEVIVKNVVGEFGDIRTASESWGTFASKAEAEAVAAKAKADGWKATVKAVKLTAAQAARAAMLASFGSSYVRKDAEKAGTWVAGKGTR
jgi:hypothetical protein